MAALDKQKNIYNLLNTLWVLPAILVGINNKVWNNNSTRSKPIKDIWKEYNLLDKYGLTKEGKQIIKLKELIEYLIRIVPYHIKDDFTKQTKINSDEYVLLRKGLGEYFKLYLYDIFDLLNYKNKKWNILDYAGGNAQYSKEFLKSNPLSNALIVDRTKNFKEKYNLKFEKINFEENEQWWTQYKNKFNLIILSEILHCKNKYYQDYLIKSSVNMLKNKGSLVICEKYPTPYFQWRMDLFTNGGECINKQTLLIDNFINNKNITLTKEINKKSHYIIEYKKRRKK